MATVPARHQQTAADQQVLARCLRRVDWCSKVLVETANDLRTVAPTRWMTADFLTAFGEHLTGVEQELRRD
jgi:hypothetical protein